MLNPRATDMHYEDPDMPYPDNFSAVAFDARWGRDETIAKGAIGDLSDLLDKVKAIPRDDTCEDALNTLEDAFSDAIGEIERARQ